MADQDVVFFVENPIVNLAFDQGAGQSWHDGKASKLKLVAVAGREGLSSPFNYRLRMIAPPDVEIEAERILGQSATVQIKKSNDDKPGEFFDRNGRVGRFYVGQATDRFAVFEAEIVPAFALLQRQGGFRIFQDLSVVDVVTRVLTDNGIDHDLRLADQSAFPPLEYCVQFGESDFNFVSRLLEVNGITYCFKHAFGKHTLLLEDRLTATDPEAASRKFPDLNDKPLELRITNPDRKVSGVNGFQEVFDVRRTGSDEVEWEWRTPEQIERTDALPTTPPPPRRDPIQDAEGARFITAYPGLGTPADATKSVTETERRAKIRLEEEETKIYLAEGACDARQFTPGLVFFFNKSDRPKDKNHYIATAVEFTAFEPRYTKQSLWDDLLKILGDLGEGALKGLGSAALGGLPGLLTAFGGGLLGGLTTLLDIGKKTAEDQLSGAKDQLLKWAEDKAKAILFEALPPGYRNHFFCVKATVRLRPPLVTPWPVVHGPQTALVVGPSLDSPEEIHTDEHGRVRVLFHWDLESRSAGANGPFSCFLRVAEGWAGGGWGQQHLPRVGQEVVVDFLGGDPDRPLITGRVYNAKNKHPFETPKFKTQSGLKTRASPTPQGQREGFHMLRFDDAKGKEQVLLRSQKRYDLRVLGSAFETVAGNRHEIVGGHNEETGEKGGDLVTTVGKEVDLHNHGGRYERTEEDYNLAVVGDTVFDLESEFDLMVGTTLQVNAKRIAIEAAQKISIKVGGSFITLDPMGVTIVGPTVRINSGGSADGTGPVEVTDPQDAAIADNGEPGFLERLPKGGPARPRTRTVNAQHGPVLGRAGNGNFIFNRGVQIDGSNRDYAEKVLQDLLTIQSQPTGKALLDRMDSSGHTTTIQSPGPGTSWLNSGGQPGANTPQDYAAATPAGQPVFDGGGNPLNDPATGKQLTGTGTGVNTTTKYDPNHFPPPPGPPNTTNAPGDVALFHELTHCQHEQSGTYDGSPTGGNFTTNEDRNTIADENKYRGERGIPPRPNHASY